VSQLDDATLQRELGRLVEAELLYQRGLPPQAIYTFKHALIQDTAYESLLRSTKQAYHHRIAEALTTRFPDMVGAQPELVAHHYTAAGINEQAVVYWHQAGRLASQQLAHAEAVAHLTQGLEVLRNLPETDERHRQELDMQLALGRSLLTIKGLGAADAEHPYRRTLELCQHIEAPAQQLAALAGLRRLASARGDIQAARDVAEQLLGLAQRQQDTPLLLEALYSLGVSLKQLGEFGAALTQFEQGIALDHHPGFNTPTNLPWVGQDPSVGIRTHAGGMLWLLGYPDQAVQQNREALTLAEHRAYPYSQTFALLWSATLHAYLRKGQISQRQAEAGIALATTHAFAGYVAWGTVLCGWARGIQGNYVAGVAQIQQGMSALESLGQVQYRGYFLYLLADIYGKAGQLEKGLRAIDAALATMETAGDQHCKAEVYRLQGELLQCVADRTQRTDVTPEACFRQALDIACQQQAKSLELRAATSLAKLWQQQGKRQDAYDLLAPVYGWFTEGFDTADLKDAKALLDELEDGRS
jgi:predicted ATPase